MLNMNLYVILLCSYNFSANGKKTSLRNYPINLSINSSKTYQLRLSKIQISIFTLPPGGPGVFGPIGPIIAKYSLNIS